MVAAGPLPTGRAEGGLTTLSIAGADGNTRALRAFVVVSKDAGGALTNGVG